jgi:hypothetical protein
VVLAQNFTEPVEGVVLQSVGLPVLAGSSPEDSRLRPRKLAIRSVMG